MKSIPIDYDLPIHTLYRKIFNDALNLRLVRSREPFIHSVIVQLLTPIAAKGGGELVSELAIQLPIRVISGMLKLKAQTISRIRAITERLWTAYGKERDPTLLRELLARCGFEGKLPLQHVSQLLSDSSRLLSKGLPAVSKSWKNQFFVRQCASGSDSTPKTTPTRYWQGWI